MSIKKQIQSSLLIVSIAAIATLMILSMFGFFNIRSGLNNQMQIASEMISSNNTHDMLSMSEQLAESMARQNAQKINGDFVRIKGELLTLKGDIESLYQGGGLQITPDDINRYEEYIVSKAAVLPQQEIDQTVATVSGVTAMFDNILAQDNKISLAYIVLENGMVFSSTKTFYPDVEKADMRTRAWYQDAISTGGLHWAEMYKGTDGRSYITVAIPVYSQGKIWGVVAFDLRVGEISDAVLGQADAAFTDAFIISDSGSVLLSTQDTADTAVSDAYVAITNQKDFSSSSAGCYQGENIIAGYATIDETGWKLVNLLNYDEMLEPVRKVEATVSTASDAMQETITRQIYTMLLVFILCFLLLIFITIFVSGKLAKRITQPLMELNKGVRIVAGGKLDYFIDIHTGDEIETLATSFNKMTCDLLDQMINLKRVTAEKERIGAELDVAKHIQASMLPSIFPAFPARPVLDIYATMTPAKEVGGDFYDFFLIDDDHLGIVMADVSGKGVPAALFMVIAKTLIKNVAQTGLSPKAVLEKVNNQLCAGNEAEMFVTVWLGILEISTGKMVCVNAGHEYPVVKRMNGDYELLKDRHGFVLAGMAHSRYTEYELQLQLGDRIFLYTDGVPEATNASNGFYGTDRMIAALNRNKEMDCKSLLYALKADVDAFVGDAPQFDDITMLSLTLIPADTFGMQKLKLPPSLEAMEKVTTFVEQSMEDAGLSMNLTAQMNIAVDEIFSNISRYSGATDATVGVKISNGCLTLRFADNGLRYDPTTKAAPDISLSAEEREIGGLGLLMVKKFMDTVEYEYHDGLNILTLKKQMN